MKTRNLYVAVLLVVALSGAAYAEAAPEAEVSSPVEELNRSNRGSMSAKDASWAEKKAERRVAREQILSKLRASSSEEKAFVREELLKNRNENPRMRGEFPKNGMPPSRRDGDRRQMNDDRRKMNSGRDMQAPPPPEYGEPHF